MKLWIAVLVFILPSSVLAHQSSTAYVSLTPARGGVDLLIELRPDDVQAIVSLDTNQDEQISWQEIQQNLWPIEEYVRQHFRVETESQCQLKFDSAGLTSRQQQSYLALPLTAICGGDINSLRVTYNLFFDLDATHRAIIQWKLHGESYTELLSPAQRTFQSSSTSDWHSFVTFWLSGIWHIWIGLDHILFLLALLLPIVVRGRWKDMQARESLHEVLLSAIGIVSAFTIAHSLTLLLNIYQIIEVNETLIECIIAGSVIMAAMNIMLPIWNRYHAAIAFIFGLFHGFGFAGVLQEQLATTNSSIALPVIGFNLGVEVGQLIIVSAIIPFIFMLRRQVIYQQMAMPVGAVTICAMGTHWLIDRIV